MKLLNWINEIKWFFQRGKRGWADCDWWSVDGYLTKILPPMLRKLRNSEWRGHPVGIEGVDNDDDWKVVLNELIWVFESAYKIIDYTIVYQPSGQWDEEVCQRVLKKIEAGEEHWRGVEVWDKETCKRFEEGFDLFKKFFFALWD